MDGIRMHERDLEAEHALPRRLVDQLGTGIREMRERGADVVDLVRDVVHPGAALREEAADRGVGAERAQELEPALADPDRRGLHALLLDPRAMLEPGAEEAFVGVERAVEILDRETDMVHRAGRVHAAIVFERLIATMRASAFGLVLAAALLSGCGWFGFPTVAAKPTSEASKPASRVFADASAAATNADSGHISGRIVANGTAVTLDLDTARGVGAKGSVTMNGLRFDLVRLQNTEYIRGSDAFWRHHGGARIARLLHGRWIKASIRQPRFRSVTALTSIAQLFAQITSHHGKLVNDGTMTYGGQQVVAIRDTSDGSRLYVAAIGTPYPVAIAGGRQKDSGTITFGDWDEPVSFSAPKGAVDISELGG
jgi:hypothetical protein